jgi:hypothetical protein
MLVSIAHGSDVRAELARHRLPAYLLAARVRMHPARLARYLNRSLPLPEDLATRIQAALGELIREEDRAR